MKFSTSSKFFYILVLSISLLLSGCESTQKVDVYTPQAFDEFLNTIFLNEVQSDSLSLNYTLSHPEDYGIKNFKPTLGDYSVSYMQEYLVLLENYQDTLKNFDYKALSPSQQISYDVVKEYIKTGLSFGDFTLYSETLGPTTGIQAQLPVLLSEYNFDDKDDIEHYLELLYCVDDYFSQIIIFEREKSGAGLFMSDKTADEIIKQCKDFISSKEDNAIIEVFNDRIQSLDWLSESDKDTYKNANKERVLNEIIPAYQLLIDGLEVLKGTGVNERGLVSFPMGKEYYEALFRFYTGSDKTIREMRSALESTIDKSVLSIQEIISENPDIVDKVTSSHFNLTNPVDILDYLEEDIKKDYPSLDSVNYSVKYVHRSLEPYLSPAFYLSPPIDNYTENSIYINGYSRYNLSEIFTTLAHEGYPGHLYQMVYYNQQNPSPIRRILNFSGYSEGWATYAEFDSYKRGILDPAIAKLMEANQVATLCMYGDIDLGVNYYGWTFDDVKNYVKKFGVTNDKDILSIYSAMVDEPGTYLKYAGGYLEILELEEKAMNKLGSQFDQKKFRTFLLDFGPAPFYIIEKHMDLWLKTR